MFDTIKGQVVDHFPLNNEFLICAADGSRVLLPIHLLPEDQQRLIKLGQYISLRGLMKDQRIFTVEGNISFD